MDVGDADSSIGRVFEAVFARYAMRALCAPGEAAPKAGSEACALGVRGYSERASQTTMLT
jgi:hypothetical protein